MDMQAFRKGLDYDWGPARFHSHLFHSVPDPVRTEDRPIVCMQSLGRIVLEAARSDQAAQVDFSAGDIIVRKAFCPEGYQ